MRVPTALGARSTDWSVNLLHLLPSLTWRVIWNANFSEARFCRSPESTRSSGEAQAPFSNSGGMGVRQKNKRLLVLE